MEKSISLLALNQRINEVINGSFTDLYWVIAEISEIKVNSAGHCYLELVEKDPDGLHISARVRATIWSYTFRILKPYFESVTKKTVEAGMKVLVKCSVEFHEVYGLSLNIQDIDPTYTIGELARKREEILQRLEEEGVISMNRELNIPLVPQRIAIISSPTAAGFEDFIQQLKSSNATIKFYSKLFPTIMQGAEAEKSIINALDCIYGYEQFFDVVVIIRGGGSQADLSCFDSYQLAYYITQFPLPIITGIGHEKDESVTDIVAHTRLKTPTAVADFIIQQGVALLNYLIEVQNRTINITGSEVQEQNSYLDNISNILALKTTNRLDKQHQIVSKATEKAFFLARNYTRSKQAQLSAITSELKHAVKQTTSSRAINLENLIRALPPLFKNGVKLQRNRLNSAEKTSQFLDPGNVLKRGYSITSANGRIIKRSKDLKPGDLIKTTYFSGESISKIENTE